MEDRNYTADDTREFGPEADSERCECCGAAWNEACEEPCECGACLAERMRLEEAHASD